jgi:hypothetical protein
MTATALEAGVIDPVRARIIADATRVLTDEHAALVEELILPKAGQQTSGQLRAALARAILAADPEAARRRRDGCAWGRHTAPAPPFPGHSDNPGLPDDSRKTRAGPRESVPGPEPQDPSLVGEDH